MGRASPLWSNITTRRASPLGFSAPWNTHRAVHVRAWELLVALFLLFGVARAGQLVRRCVSGSLGHEPLRAAPGASLACSRYGSWLPFTCFGAIFRDNLHTNDSAGSGRGSEWRADATELRAGHRTDHAVNQSYVRLHGSTDRGSPTPAADLSQVHEALEQGYVTAHEALSLTPSLAQPRTCQTSCVVAALQPSRNRRNLLSIHRRSELQQGHPKLDVATRDRPREGTPTGVSPQKTKPPGLPCCLYAPLPGSYSGLLFAQRQVAGALLRIEPEDAIRIIKQRHPGVQRDVNAHRAFWMGHRGA